MTTLQQAIQELYNIAITNNKKSSTKRLDRLADYCIEQFEMKGLKNVEKEGNVKGFVKDKNWDVCWQHHGKYRMGISLKSNLSNLAGVAPNAIDNLLGEVTDAQMNSPEFISGYIMVIDVSKDNFSRKHQCTWRELIKRRLKACSVRKAPCWTFGTLEAFVVIEVDFSSKATLVTSEGEVLKMFDELIEEIKIRNSCECS